MAYEPASQRGQKFFGLQYIMKIRRNSSMNVHDMTLRGGRRRRRREIGTDLY